MNELQKKHIEVAKKLLKQSMAEFSYTVISDSMKPLLEKGDKIVCLKTNFNDVKKYSLVAFCNEYEQSNVPKVHRIIKKIIKNNKTLLLTKGDNVLFADKELVREEMLIGVVSKIIKKYYVINTENFPGRFVSVLLYYLSFIKNIFRLFLFQLNKFCKIAFVKENKCTYNDDLAVVRQSVIVQTLDWQAKVNNGVKLIENLVNKNMKICDISFGGGYCEESFVFIRKGFEIDYKKIDTLQNKNEYDLIVCSGVINVVDTKQQRNKIYENLKLNIKKNGIVLLSYISEKNNFLIKTKRKIYKLMYKKYDGPSYDDIVYDKFFVMKEISANKISKELGNSGFFIMKLQKSKKAVNFLLCVK